MFKFLFGNSDTDHRIAINKYRIDLLNRIMDLELSGETLEEQLAQLRMQEKIVKML